MVVEAVATHTERNLAMMVYAVELVIFWEWLLHLGVGLFSIVFRGFGQL
uniref:Uncharacterized protein n=1 Tax=Parascaris equorum TaxID=6256 RepID=A0A914RFA1_PAREQ